jgi:ABC-type transport system substrate-binding protein
MKTINEQIAAYTQQLQQGEIQIAYKGILAFMGKLRAAFIKKYPHYDVSNIYQGYLDMSYFSLSTKPLKEKGLKIAIVYLHEKGSFEVWLSARNRDIARTYQSIPVSLSDEINVFHDKNNQDAVAEYILTGTPDFEDQALLIDTIDYGVEKFVAAIVNRIK